MRHLEQKHVEDTYEVPHRAREREILQLLAKGKANKKVDAQPEASTRWKRTVLTFFKN
jgi:DNA-binding NarL/FixJ family response regulator